MNDIINKISSKLTEIITKDNYELSDDRKEVIKYGIFAFFQMALSIILVIVFGLIFNVLIEALIISFTISILRKSSGGAHASSSTNCLIIGTVISIIPSILIKHININIIYVILIGLIVYLFSYFLINKLAPVDSPGKPIRSDKKINRLKKSSITTLNIFYLIIIIEILVYYFITDRNIINYIISLYIGLIWQVITLTSFGHKLICVMDSFFYKLQFHKEV